MEWRKPTDKLETVVSVVFWVVIIALIIALLLSFGGAIRAANTEPSREELNIIVPITVSMEMKPVDRSLPVCGKAPVYIEAEVIVEEEPEPAEIQMPTYTEEELEALALAIYQEAGGDECSDETRLMVGTVVLNRVADDRFPDTIQDVLTQEAQYGRLHWTGLVWPERASWPEEAYAVDRAYDLAEALLGGAIVGVLPADVIFQCEYVLGEIVAERDGFYFCK